MSAVALILVLLGATAAVRVLAERFDIPHPALLVLGGLALAVTPGLPRATLDPDVVFLIFVPPLLYFAAFNTSWRDLRTSLRLILLAAIGIVAVTMIAVAAVAHVTMAFAWPTAFVLGAIVAPSDAVATTAVTRELNVRHAITTVLDGESLMNDAVAFIAYRYAVRATVSNEFALAPAALQFLLAGAGGIAIGVVVGMVMVSLRQRIPHLPEIDSTLSLLTPYVAFIPADHFGLSSVLAVVAAGLCAGRQVPRVTSAQTRVQTRDTWIIVTFLLEGLIFILIGLDLPVVMSTVGRRPLMTLIGYGVVVSITTIAVRLAWVIPVGSLRQRIEKRLRSQTVAFSLRELFFIGWAGLRGADSLVIALALPLTVASGRPFPERGPIIFITFTVIFVTLVIQGLSLGTVIRRLRLRGDGREQEELIEARLQTAKAGLARLDRIIDGDPALADEARRLKRLHRHRVHRYALRRRHGIHRRDESLALEHRRVRKAMIEAERDELLRLRDRGTIGDEVVQEILRELDLEELLMEPQKSVTRFPSPD